MWHYSFVILLLCIGLGHTLPTSIADIINDSEQQPLSEPAGDVSTIPETTQPPSPNRRVITYDQRQEGKYNFRADLENFVIMVIPSSPASASSLLSLLTRSKLKKNRGKNNLKRKYSQKHDSNVKEGVKKLDYLPLRPADHSERSNTRIIEHFIEGRTPYKVDISSNGEYLHPQVQVIQPNYARSLRSPVVRLEPDEPIASVVPVKGNSNPIQNSVTVKERESKTLFEANQIDDSNTNSLVILTPNDNDNYNSESNGGFVDLTDPINSFDSLNVGNVDQFTVTTVNEEANNNSDDGSNSSSSNDDRGWELTLLGSQEQCGPDRKRDSYGVCQFVPHDY